MSGRKRGRGFRFAEANNTMEEENIKERSTRPDTQKERMLKSE